MRIVIGGLRCIQKGARVMIPFVILRIDSEVGVAHILQHHSLGMEE
jgi:hypothetical protein